MWSVKHLPLETVILWRGGGEAAGWRGSEIPPSPWGAKESEEAEEPAAGHARRKRLYSYKAAPSTEKPGRPSTACLQGLIWVKSIAQLFCVFFFFSTLYSSASSKFSSLST